MNLVCWPAWTDQRLGVHVIQEEAAESQAPRWRRLSRLLFAAAVLQVLFWVGLRPLLYDSPKLPPLYAVSSPEAAILASPDAEGLARATFKPVELPWSDCCGPGYRAVRFNVDIPVVPEAGVALVPNLDADNLLVRVNGQPVVTHGRMTLPKPTYEGNVKHVYQVPPAMFRPGLNQVEYVMVRQVLPYFDVTKPIFADYAVAWPLFKAREFILTDYEMIGAAIGAVIALFAVVMLLRSTRRGLAAALLVLVGAWSLLAQFYFWLDPPFSAATRMNYYFALVNLLPVAWLNFADQWTRRPFRWIAPLSVLGYLACVGVSAWALQSMPRPDGFDLASDLVNWFGLAFSAAAILRFVWHVVTSGEDRVLEFAVFALCISLLAADLFSELLWERTGGFVVRSMPLLLLAFVAAFLARNIRLFQSTHEINQLLTARLAEREAELAETYRRESDLVRREAHQAERQRLMRDMHDGVGSQLTSMLFAARRNALPADQLAGSLQTVIDEIRLLIDSMDSTSDSLASAVGSFQQRAAPRLEAAGVTLAFQPVPAGLLPAYGPREVLQVVRILQEAVNNALRHSGGNRIELEINATGNAAFPAELVVRDNGAGFKAEMVPGRGLSNMESRATALGATFEVDRAGDGVAVRLRLPAQGKAEPA